MVGILFNILGSCQREQREGALLAQRQQKGRFQWQICEVLQRRAARVSAVAHRPGESVSRSGAGHVEILVEAGERDLGRLKADLIENFERGTADDPTLRTAKIAGTRN